MDAVTLNEIIHRWHRDQSQREIARALRVSRNTISSAIRRFQAARTGDTPDTRPMRARRKRDRLLDRHADEIRGLLARYPDIRVTKLLSILETRRRAAPALACQEKEIGRSSSLQIRNKILKYKTCSSA